MSSPCTDRSAPPPASTAAAACRSQCTRSTPSSAGRSTCADADKASKVIMPTKGQCPSDGRTAVHAVRWCGGLAGRSAHALATAESVGALQMGTPSQGCFACAGICRGEEVQTGWVHMLLPPLPGITTTLL